MMNDDLHRLVRMHLHDDLDWTFGGELHPCRPDGRSDELLDQLCQRLGFESLGNGVWRVALSSPHYVELWTRVVQERLDEQGG
jgi:hypothetical protein